MADLDKVKRNVAKMVTMGAPESDIDAYIASQGATIEAVRKHKSSAASAMSHGEQMLDMARSARTGIAQGINAAAGLPGDVAALANRGVEKLTGYKFSPPENPLARALLRMPPTTQEMRDRQQEEFGPYYEPQTTAGKYSKTVAEFAPAAAVGPGALGVKVATQAVIPGVASEAAGQATEDTMWEPYARLAGGVAGAVAPSALRRVMTPLPIPPERAAAVQALKKEGVDLTAGQATGRKGLQYVESEIGGAAAQRIEERQRDQFTGAIMRRVGSSAKRAGPQEMDDAFTRVGGEFDRLASGNTVKLDSQFGRDLASVVGDYAQLVPSTQRAPIVANLIKDLRKARGSLPGETYQSYRSRIDKLARGSTDPQLADALRGIRESLDTAMERSLLAAGKSKDAAAWRQARREYRNLLVVEKAVSGAGGATGAISPAKLRTAVVGQNRRGYVRGKGDFASLARAGDEVMQPLPNSGTASRVNARGIPTYIGMGLGGALGSGAGPVGITAGGLLGAAGGAVAPWVAGRAVMHPWTQGYLKNQLMPGHGLLSAGQRAAIVGSMTAPQIFRDSPPF